MKEELRVIISGGGTGGHIFPAISIANALKEKHPECKILFVGAEGRMEMKKVPAAGYEIKALPICGFDRKNLFKKFCSTLQNLQKQNSGTPDYQRIQTDGSCWCRRLCQWTDTKCRGKHGHSDLTARTKLLCRGHQQTSGQESQQDLCCL